MQTADFDTYSTKPVNRSFYFFSAGWQSHRVSLIIWFLIEEFFLPLFAMQQVFKYLVPGRIVRSLSGASWFRLDSKISIRYIPVSGPSDWGHGVDITSWITVNQSHSMVAAAIPVSETNETALNGKKANDERLVKHWCRLVATTRASKTKNAEKMKMSDETCCRAATSSKKQIHRNYPWQIFGFEIYTAGKKWNFLTQIIPETAILIR